MHTIATLNWIDFSILAVILLSILLSVARGFVREALSLTAWITAAFVTLLYYKELVPLLPQFISNETVRIAIACAIIFLAIVIAGTVISYLVSKLVEATPLSPLNRLLGLFFGAGRGVLLVALVLLMTTLTSIPQYSSWQKSVLIPEFKPVEVWIQSFLPDYVNKHFPQHNNVQQAQTNDDKQQTESVGVQLAESKKIVDTKTPS